MAAITFPDNFMFGAATASYQIEGAVNEGGRGASIWDTFSHQSGNVANDDNGDIADDSYHRYGDDIRLLTELGVDAYRFSVAMPRVVPDQTCAINQEGLDYYDRIVDGLLQEGIKPIVTLYHWDLPQYLQDQNGWLNRDTAYHLADYARAVAERLGDRVHMWTTLNEPSNPAFLGYGNGEHAPGLKLGPRAFEAVHHLNLAHGLMVQAIRQELGGKAKCSVTHILQTNRGDADAVHRLDLIANRIWLDPMLRGYYPQELFAATHDICDWDFIHDGDLEQIHQPLDMLGINYYSTGLVAMSGRPQFPQSTEPSATPGASDIDFLPTPGEHTQMGWNVDPNGLYDLLMRLTNDFPDMPLLITENGIAVDDCLTEDGMHVHDAERIDYVKRHLQAAGRAMQDGADLRGYFLWSLLDNFEWSLGYSKRFGLVYVDYETLHRIPKDSFEWYKTVIRQRDVR